jgi:hypothetical protein
MSTMCPNEKPMHQRTIARNQLCHQARNDHYGSVRLDRRSLRWSSSNKLPDCWMTSPIS